MRNAECGMRNAECGMRNAECGMRNADRERLDMGIVKKAEGGQSITDPKTWKLFNRPVTESVVMVFQSEFLRRVLAAGGYDEGKSRKLSESRVYPPPVKGMPTLVGPAIGSPMAAFLLEVLIALGAKRVLGFGVCGSLSTDLKIGDLLVATEAASEEGTSSHYFPDRERFLPSEELLKRLTEKLDEKELRYTCAPVWTTDAFFMETAEKVDRLNSEGVQGVEMEMSALCAVAEYRGIEYASLMVVSDELAGKRWKPGFAMPGFKKAMKSAFDFLAELRF
jgi:uridine phosphorylase